MNANQPTKLQATILSCLRANVENAPHARKRAFAEERLAGYEKELAKRWQPVRGNVFTRFEEKLNDQEHAPR